MFFNSSSARHFIASCVCACFIFTVFIFIGGRETFAQDSPSWNKTQPKEAPRPAPKPATKPARAAAPRRAAPRPAPARRPAAAALLSVQYRIFKVNNDNTQIEVSPVTIFNTGDRVRFAVKSNDDVFLYIVHQETPNGTGKMLFPDSRINSGQNFVRKDQEFVIPSACAAGTPATCSLQVNASAGKEYFTLILSRDAALDLSGDATGGGGEISLPTLNRITGTPNGNPIAPRRGDTVFSLLVRNSDPRLNDRIVVRYVLNKRGRQGQ